MNRYRQAVADLVDGIALELDRLGLWAPVPPAAARIESSVPFSYDTLDWHQWLQWRFVPRMRALLDARAPLPDSSAIRPYVESCLDPVDSDAPGRLLGLLGDFDALISDHVETGPDRAQ